MNIFYRAIITCFIFLTISVPTFCQSDTYSGWTTDRLFKHGSDHLKRFNSLHTAVVELEQAAKAEPENAVILSALGCAYAARVESIVMDRRLYTQAYTMELGTYDNRRKRWEVAQGDVSNNLNGQPPPTPLMKPYIRPENLKYITDDEATLHELLRLSAKCKASFDRASELTAGAEREQRVSIEYARGWGLFLLRRFGSGIIKGIHQLHDPEIPEDQKVIVAEKEIKEAFLTCTKLDPSRAEYWRSLALATVPVFTQMEDHVNAIVEDDPLCSREEIDEASKCLEKALLIRRRNYDCLSLLSLIHTVTNPDKALKYLDECMKLRSGNALHHYQKAVILFKQMSTAKDSDIDRFRELALTAVDQGNKMTGFQQLTIDVPAPPLLRRAWLATNVIGFGEETLMYSNFQYLLSEETPLRVKLDSPLLLRVTKTEFEIGLHFMSRVGGEDFDPLHYRTILSLNLIRLFSPVCCYNGFQSMEEIYRSYPTDQLRIYLDKHRDDANRAREYERRQLAGN